ncbi:hypothetical protein FKM82_017237 [Ascaphus truei]
MQPHSTGARGRRHSRYMQTFTASPEWRASRLDKSLNPFPHSPHTCGLSPVCVLLCLVRWDNTLNPFSHSPHTYGLSPVCVLLCVSSLDKSLNPFPHSPHTCGLSPVCVLMCVFRLYN